MRVGGSVPEVVALFKCSLHSGKNTLASVGIAYYIAFL